MSNETEQVADQDAMADDWAAAMEEQSDSGSTVDKKYEKVEARTLEKNSSSHHGEVNLDVILDIPVTISMEIGRTRISIRNLLQLNQGSVIELDRLAGEPMDVIVNGTLVAHGEVVVVNEKFGIRLTDVVSPTERIKNLK
jgi:flagellar motor switch protein FliN/FliY